MARQLLCNVHFSLNIRDADAQDMRMMTWMMKTTRSFCRTWRGRRPPDSPGRSGPVAPTKIYGFYILQKMAQQSCAAFAQQAACLSVHSAAKLQYDSELQYDWQQGAR